MPHPAVAYWDVLEGIARITDYILKPWQQMVRTWGWVANAARGKRRRQAEQGNAAGLEARSREEPEDAFARRARLSWACLSAGSSLE